MTEADGPPRAALIAALALAVVAIGGILVIAAGRRAPQQPVAIAAVPAPQAGTAACKALLDALPGQLGDYRRAELAQPAPDGAAAWRGAPGDEPVVLRCGVDRPADFGAGSVIQIDRVQWFEARADDRATWYTLDRPVYVALTLPPGSGPTPIQQLSTLVDHTIAAVPVNGG